MKKSTFILHTEWFEPLREFNPDVRLEVYEAIFEYMSSGTICNLSSMAKDPFFSIKKTIDEFPNT